MEIRYAQEKNIPELYELWHTCFGDSRENIDMFFECSYKQENTLVMTDEGKTVSMMFLLPEDIISEGNTYSAYYLYALGTDPAFRGQGIMGKMIEHAARILEDRDADYMFLVPADGHLFEYYRKHGFRNAFRQRKYILLPEDIAEIKKVNSVSSAFSPEKYRKSRKENLRGRSYADWNESETELANKYFTSGNGEMISSDDSFCFIDHGNDGDCIYDMVSSDILYRIPDHIISGNVEINTPADLILPFRYRYYDCGMARNLRDGLPSLQNTFMGFTLG